MNLHRIAHWFGWNTGNVVSWWGDDGWCYIGFQCSQCGEVNHGHRRAFRRSGADARVERNQEEPKA